MSGILTTPDDAEEAFYDAIARADLDALMNLWAEDEEIICIHPGGQPLSGHHAIRESWQQIFASNPRFRVHVRRSVRWKGVLLAVHSVVESLYLGDDSTPHGPVLSTHVFQRGAKGWRLLSRHSSICADSPEDSKNDPERQARTLH